MVGRFRYGSVDGTGVAVEFTAPPSWSSCCGGFTESTDGTTQFSPWVIDLVFPDPCERSIPPTEIGSTVEDVVNALSAQPGRTPVRPSPSASVPPFSTQAITISGFSGIRMQLQVPFDAEFAACTGGEYVGWTGSLGPDETRYNQTPGQIDDLRIVDVDGTTLTLHTGYVPTTSPARRAELDALIESVVITPAPPGSVGSRVPTQAPIQEGGFLPIGEFP